MTLSPAPLTSGNEISLSTYHGHIVADFVTGKTIRSKAGHGSLKFGNVFADSVLFQTYSGDIAVTHASASKTQASADSADLFSGTHFSAKTSNGNIDLGSVESESVMLRTYRGHIGSTTVTAQSVHGKTRYGNITLASIASDTLALSTYDGNIKTSRALNGNSIVLETRHGNIDAPSVTAVSFSAKTSTGDVNLGPVIAEDLTLQTYRGHIAAATVAANTMNVKTRYGNVTLSTIDSDSVALITYDGNINTSGVLSGKSLSLETRRGEINVASVGATNFSAKTTTGSIQLGPTNSKHVTLRTYRGHISAASVNSTSLKGETRYGNITLGRIGSDSLALRSYQGNIQTARITKGVSVTLESSQGDIDAASIKTASVGAKTITGNISVGPINSEIVRLQTYRGHIVAPVVKAKSVVSETRYGNISLNRIDSDSLVLKTYEGDIKTSSALKGTSATLELKNGDITTKSVNTKVFNAKTVNGNIDLGPIVSETVKLRTYRGHVAAPSVEAKSVTGETLCRGKVGNGRNPLRQHHA